MKKNWSGNVQWDPATIAFPETEKAIQQLVLQALRDKRNIRMIGTGHSFTPLSQTSDVLLSLDNYQGLVSVDKTTHQVRVRAGTKLHRLGELLFEQGLAMENMGDVDRQSIAGTISTGTHGTGMAFGTISTQVKAIRLVNGLGEIVECSEQQHASLFKAAQVSLGALGIITEMTLQCVPAYKLELVNEKKKLAEVLKNYSEINAANRNFEFYWFPHTEYVLTKTSNLANEKPNKAGLSAFFQEYLLENMAFKLLCEYAYRFPAKNKWVSNFSAQVVGSSRKVYRSHKVYATPRLVKFNEMEYNVPLNAYEEVMGEVVKCIEQNNFPVHFPIENRFVRKDDIYLSPAYGRDSAYIACHVYYKKPYQAYFQALENIFKAYEGRPHWGKIHTLEFDELEKRYPRFNDFLQHRQQQDPHQLFLSPYLQKLFFP
jgi:FAD-linked oxidoreductase